MIYSANGVVITLTYFLLPFAVLPIYGNMRAIQDATLEAARDLGASPWQTLRDIVMPQCERGIAVAFMFTFLISVGDYVTPRFVGGGAAMMGQFHRDAVLLRLQLADGQRHGLHHHGACRC